MIDSNIFDITGLANCVAPDCTYETDSDFRYRLGLTMDRQGENYVQIWDYDEDLFELSS
jgi:hypothetical protein